MTLGKVWLVGAGPGDPGLMTVRGRELLGIADAVLYDALAHPALLEACREDAELIDVGKRPGERTGSQEAITAQLIALARAGRKVVRLKGGDPLLFARGAEEALDLALAGVPFEIVPGVASPIGAAAYAGISLTHRELSSSVTFITGSDRAGVAWSPDAWRKLATATDTICILMGMRNIEAITRAIVEGGRAESTPVAVIHWATRPEQRVLVATLGDVAARVRAMGLTNPSIIVVGEVVSLREKLRFYDARPLFGKRVLVPRPAGQADQTARELRERSAAPLVIPAIEVVAVADAEPLARAVAELADYDWVLFTSSNGVEYFFAALSRAGRDARAFGKARVGVVGPRTGETLARYGMRADLVSDEREGEGLGRAVVALGPPGRVLLPRAKIAGAELPRVLALAGARVDDLPVYETRATAEIPAIVAALRARSVDVVLFTSGSTARAVVDAVGEDRAVFAEVTVASIGPVTTRALKDLGLSVHAEGDGTVSGLLDELERYFAAEP